MVEKFQSYPAMKAQIAQQRYEYFQILPDQSLAGYIGIRQDEDALFLSKLYIHKDFRGQHLATKAFHFLIDLCKERSLKKSPKRTGLNHLFIDLCPTGGEEFGDLKHNRIYTAAVPKKVKTEILLWSVVKHQQVL